MIANITPSGKYLMEDFFYAGGLRALMAAMREPARSFLPHRHRPHASAKISMAPPCICPTSSIRSMRRSIAEGATAVLTGNLAPHGCVMKPAAADPRFLKHRGKAIAFENYNHMAREVERDDLDVTPDHVLVLKNAGPKGGPGMPEWGMLPIPKKLVKAGVRDMVRISDARMSGTSYGACILHVAPESFVGGPLALVQTGDEIEIDVAARRIHLHVGDDELARRRAAWTAAAAALRARLRRDVFRSISARPTKAATSIFCKARRRSPSRRFISRHSRAERSEEPGIHNHGRSRRIPMRAFCIVSDYGLRARAIQVGLCRLES